MTASVCALGFFDGVHEAHSLILRKCITHAKEHGLKSIALTFEKSPAEYFGKKIKYLTTLDQKKQYMKELGIDEVVVLPCDEKTLSLAPEEFVNDILIGRLNVTAVFCGFNYTFGKNASGNTNKLISLCKGKGIDVIVTPCMTDYGVTVSSSEIRSILSRGDIALANLLLTRPFEVWGNVAEGKKLGRQLDFPTANIYPGEFFPDLPKGVYATKTVIDNAEYPSVTNVGVNPTVKDGNLRIETFIINFNGDIYGKNIRIKFFNFLRPEKEFPSVDELKKQISADTENTIQYFKSLH